MAFLKCNKSTFAARPVRVWDPKTQARCGERRETVYDCRTRGQGCAGNAYGMDLSEALGNAATLLGQFRGQAVAKAL